MRSDRSAASCCVQVRKWFPGWQFEVFNLVFICFYQHALILAFTTPAAVALQPASEPWSNVDSCATVLFAVLLAGETTADYQQLVYQTEKYRRKAAREPAGPYARGFIETGVWSWSRYATPLTSVRRVQPHRSAFASVPESAM
jgi:steroid 5-alpha reductase family enzyme